MNVEELRTVKRTERQKDSLQHLRDSFYRDVAEYVAERKAERERAAAAADDPFSSPEVGRLTDEIETAEAVVESIYERRVGKVVKRATFAAAGMATEDEGLTTEERDLFEDLVERIETNREAVLDGLVADADAGDGAASGDGASATGDAAPANDDPAGPTGDAPTPQSADDDPVPPTGDGDRSPTDDAAAPDPDDLLAEAMGGDDSTATDGGATTSADASDGSRATPSGDEPAATAPGDGPPATAPDEPSGSGGEADEGSDLSRTTLRITQDVGSILGVDEREYDLASEDVVTLPTANADPLLERDAAERLDGA